MSPRVPEKESAMIYDNTEKSEQLAASQQNATIQQSDFELPLPKSSS